jgi:TatD DNase family protein
MFDCHTHSLRLNPNAVVNSGLKELTDYFFSYGIHPYRVDKENFNYELAKISVVNANCLAIGEIGLDKTISTSLALQIEIFKAQIALSEEMELPVILHCVKAWNEVQQIKKTIKPKQTWIFHGLSKANLIESVLKEGLMISIGASILTNTKLQNALHSIPIERLLIETDDAEVEILKIYEKVSEIKGISLQTLKENIAQNFKSVFIKWHNGLNVQN